MSIEVRDPHPRLAVDLAGGTLAYVDTQVGFGAASAVVFLHGNPASSYIWRNVIGALVRDARCLAPDLPGMGDSSAAVAAPFRFAEHLAAIEAWFDAVLPTQGVVLVGHDWGSALAFAWAQRHAARVQGLCYMEAFVGPLRAADFPTSSEWWQIRAGTGDPLILDRNIFIEEWLAANVIRSLDEAELDAYRRPFRSRDARRVMIGFPQQVPIDGDPADVHEAFGRYAGWLRTTPTPKLLIRPVGGPASMLSGRALAACRAWPNQTEAEVRGGHYLQEDSPAAIGAAIRDWLRAEVPEALEA